jgi:EmrB/QacA subfamily drug resistance transporter
MTSVSAPPSTPPPVLRPHLPLAVVVAISCVASFMVILDTAIVNVALPAMRADLDLSTSSQQWVVNAYLLTFGGLLLLAARAADLYGRRRVFQFGLVVFTLASLVGGLAENGAMLLGARAVQGIGAAALAPSSLSLIIATHHDPHERGRALAIWGAAASGSAAFGVVAGGLLTDWLNWRWVLFINVPIGIALSIAVAVSLLPAHPAATRARLDVPGAIAVTAGFAALIYGISQATDSGWSSTEVIGSLTAALLLLAGFVAIETRTAEPLVRLTIFALHNLRTANLIMLGLGASMTAPLFFLSLYLQQLIGYTPLRAGLALLPMTVVMAAGSFVARFFLSRGVHHLAVYGGLLTGTGLLWLTQLPPQAAYLTHVLGPTLVLGAGLGMMILPLTVAATTGIPHHEAGLASGLMNMSRQIGGAVGLAVLVTIASSVTSGQSGPADLDATLHGFHIALLVAAGVALVCAVGATRFRRA